MTRRALWATLALPCIGRASKPLVQYHTFATDNAQNLPSVSDFQARYGVVVDVAASSPNSEMFSVRIRYRTSSGIAEQVKPVLRDRSGVTEGWTSTTFWCGEPVGVLTIEARECAAVAVARVQNN